MMDNRGQIVVVHPPHQPNALGKALLFHGLVPILVPFFFAYKLITDKPFRASFPTAPMSIYSLVSAATIRSIRNQWYFQNAALLQKLWKLPSARAYIGNLEYQKKVGFCGPATQRCILRSFSMCPDTLPPQKYGDGKPETWCEHITHIAREHSRDDEKVELSTKIVRGDVGYDEFLLTLRDGMANANVRIACNYLRSALFGFEKIRYIPANLIIGMCGGHFSPILGIIENDYEGVGGNKIEDNNPLVAIFDTNHNYNGVYFVPARRLHEAVRSFDFANRSPRTLLLVEKNKT
mmetsp:Transcript_27830/g.52446  ORF Transcript_27830/g.52446 Transcript_27830/m.52446 type:complete len:292 (+) Transcript_27830:74-949(+)